jgi:uncharacterized protein YqhQ
MMRGQKSVVTAVRRPGGEVVLNVQPLSHFYIGWMGKTPLLRGVVVLIEALILGVKSLLYSANVSLEEEEEELSGWMVWALLAVSMLIAVALFFMAPLFLTRLFDSYIQSSLVFHLVEGLVRVAIFILYLWLVSLMPSIRQVFAYHGAEHKSINAYEGGVPLEVEAVREYSTAHRRCGTSFLFVVLVIAIVVFSIIGRSSLLVMIASRIIFVPVIAALGYEVIRFSAAHAHNPIVRAIAMPGLWLQSLTTRQPDDGQIEVALSALRKAIEIDRVEVAKPEEAVVAAPG